MTKDKSIKDYSFVKLVLVYLNIRFSGHRGYKALEIENTKAAFLKAIDEKLDYVELDLRKTSDEIVVVFHDKKINKLLNARGSVDNYSITQLKSFKYDDGQNVMTFEELLALVKRKINLIIDVKTKGIEQTILNLLKKFEMNNSVIIQSYSGVIIKRFQKLNPELNYALFRTLMGKRLPFHRGCARLFYRLFIKKYNVKYLNIDGPFLYDELAELLHKEGIKIILGARKVEKYLHNLEKWNIEVLNVNNPKEIKEKLEQLKIR